MGSLEQKTNVAGAKSENASPDREHSLHLQTHVAEIVEALESVRNGYVQIVVQDGRIVQIDRMEKRRLR